MPRFAVVAGLFGSLWGYKGRVKSTLGKVLWTDMQERLANLVTHSCRLLSNSARHRTVGVLDIALHT